MKSQTRSASLLFAASLVLLLLFEALRVYWIMPFAGSQRGGTLGWAYGIHHAIPYLRFLFGAAALWALISIFRFGSRLGKTLATLGVAAYAFLAYQANGPMSADVMFLEPSELAFAGAAETTWGPSTPVVGIAVDGPGGQRQARAYPVQLIGYHHQVRDTVAGRPVMVTYCTVCRTGRVYDPVVEGKAEQFRLVGMDQFNAMFEDGSTGTWWRQVSGQAVAGPRKGAFLTEIPSRQMTWQAWLGLHPDSTVMEPDPLFAQKYAKMAGYAEGTSGGALTGRNSESWQEKSWVVGVATEGGSRAFDWNELTRDKVIADRVGEVPVLLVLGADGASFYAFDARPPGSETAVELEKTDDPSRFLDRASGSVFSEQGLALEGPLAGTRLAMVAAYQEFWHSWRTFHPDTTARRTGA